eukprot:366238-Chlamydomonas_euryale.AAC.2
MAVCAGRWRAGFTNALLDRLQSAVQLAARRVLQALGPERANGEGAHFPANVMLRKMKKRLWAVKAQGGGGVHTPRRMLCSEDEGKDDDENGDVVAGTDGRERGGEVQANWAGKGRPLACREGETSKGVEDVRPPVHALWNQRGDGRDAPVRGARCGRTCVD